jgi:hypothetical protein
VIDEHINVPYTIQSMVSLQRAVGRTLAVEAAYIRTNGRDFPLQRQFVLARDRVTGLMPNPQLGAPGGYYVDSNQTMIYNGLQTSVRKRFSNHYSFDANYTFSKGTATQGGDLAVYSSNVNTQDFWIRSSIVTGGQRSAPSPERCSSRSSRSRLSESVVKGVAGGWQVGHRHRALG